MPFKVITYDVEHGSSHVLITPNNKVIMIDAGSKSDFSPAKHLKENWNIQNIDWLTVTHFDADHLTDIASLAEHYQPKVIQEPTISKQELDSIYNEQFSTPLDVYMTFKEEGKYYWPVPHMGHEVHDWGGVTFATFQNNYSDLSHPNMNDLSVVTFAEFAGKTFIFPGDIEEQGWLKLLERPEFVAWLKKVNVFVASHHGRDSGFCQKVFLHAKPTITIFSDKSVIETSRHDKYYAVTSGINLRDTTGKITPLRVFTTRKDGAITIEVDILGGYKISSSN